MKCPLHEDRIAANDLVVKHVFMGLGGPPPADTPEDFLRDACLPCGMARIRELSVHGERLPREPPALRFDGLAAAAAGQEEEEDQVAAHAGHPGQVGVAWPPSQTTHL